MSLIYFHPYHIVDQSPWPLTSAFGALIITAGTVSWFKGNSSLLIFIGVSIIILTSVQWWRDVSREAALQGHHSFEVETNIRMGIILFIVSEVLFFISFFWAFFHSRLAPCIEIGILWPPKNIRAFNPFQIPLLNTIILLSSGVSVTWAHHRLIENNHSQTKKGLIITVILGLYFTLLQGYEYFEASFSFADSVYGSTFFLATGFHGLHVIIGTTFLIVCLRRLSSFQFSSSHHFGFEAAAWYWHFVDVVWLFLFITIYWWGSYFYSIKSISHFQWEGLILVKIISTLLVIIILILIIALAIIATASALRKKRILDREKSSPFECGFDPFSNSRIPFSLRFYIIAIIFLIFDVEIAILLPMPVIFPLVESITWLLVSSIFVATLLLGLFHEWNFGALEWSN